MKISVFQIYSMITLCSHNLIYVIMRIIYNTWQGWLEGVSIGGSGNVFSTYTGIFLSLILK